MSIGMLIIRIVVGLLLIGRGTQKLFGEPSVMDTSGTERRAA